MVSVVDGVLHHFGKPGGFHLLVTILLCCNFFPIAFHHMNNIFYASDIPHTCRLPEGWPWHKKFSIPKATSHGQIGYDECRMYVDPNSDKLGTKPCVYGWEFYPQGREWTIVAEWGLVCEREYLVTLAAVVYHGGIMFGGLVFGTLADKFGRKPLMLFTLYVQTAISIGIYFVQNFILFVILRFIHGLLLQGLQCATICLVMELLPMRYRTAAGMGCSIFWAVALISLSLVSYSVQHWRYIQLAISLPCLVTFLYLWLIPESVRWLITVTKTENALITARKFEQFNKRPLSENFSKDVEMATGHISSNIGQVESYGMRELLLQGSKLRVSCLVQCFCWFSTSSLYHALTTRLLEVGSNRYTGTIIIGAVDLVAFVVMYFLLVRFGRKRPICVLLVLCGAVCISTIVAENLDKKDGLEVYVVSTVLALVERSCVAACLSGLTICAAELFPTVVRTFGIGICLFCGEVGWIAAPQILKLNQYALRSLPWIIFGVLTLLGGLLVLLLPETLTMPLPDTLEDTESFESRKTPIQTKEEESVVTSNPYAHDWKTSYRQKIEEANGNLSLYDSAEDTKDTAEKKWYHPNYSQKSGKVVRFYGLDTCEDPCQEVKTNKKQRIRMVRFSFDNEFCNITKSPPVEICRKFSVIPEEPEMDPALLDDVVTSLSDNLEIKDCNLTEDVVDHDDTQLQGTKCEASCQDNDCATVDVVQSTVEEQKTRFTVQKVQGSDLSECASQELESQEVKEDGDVTQTVVSELEDSEASESKPSRFIVQRVQDTDVELSQVATVENLDASDSLNQTEKRSRFSVQRVSEPTLIESSPQMTMANETTTSSSSDIDESRIVHQNYPQSTVIDDTASNSSVIKNNSRFVVQRVLEPKLTVVHSQQVTNEDIKVRCENDDGQVNIPKDCVPDVSMQESKFRVEQVSESNLTSHNSSMEMSPNIQPSEEVNSIGVQKKSRFVVQRVTEPDNPLVLKTDDRLKSHQGETADDTESHRISSPGNQLLTEKKSRFAVCRVPELTLEQTSVQHPSGDANKLQNNNVDRNHNQVERKSRFVVQRVYDDALQDIDNREKHCNNNDICIDKMDNGYRPFSREECDNFQNWQVLLKNGVNSSLSSADGGVKNSNNSAKDLTETTIDEARLRGGQFEVVSCS